MSDHPTPGAARPDVGLEIPMEALPEGPIVPRPPEADIGPETHRTAVAALPASIEPPLGAPPEPVAVSAPAPVESGRQESPHRSPLPSGEPAPARFTDTRRPLRAAAGLVALCVFGAVALAAVIGMAVALVAIAVNATAS